MAAGGTAKTQQKGGEDSQERAVGMKAGYPLEPLGGRTVLYKTRLHGKVSTREREVQAQALGSDWAACTGNLNGALTTVTVG